LRGPLLPASLAFAATATAALVYLALRRSAGPAEPEAPEERAARSPEAPPASAADRLRPYETTATLTEDLRDALAGDPGRLDGEFWRVSAALAGRAVWMLQHAAPDEASPRVRALLVLACGVHDPDGAALLAFLDDRVPLVRQAAALAAGYRAGGRPVRFLGEVLVPLGRRPGEATAARMRARLAGEDEEGVRGTLGAVLDAASSPR
jgi:hypothetical protein